MKKIYIGLILFLVIFISGCKKELNGFDISFMIDEYSIYEVVKTNEGKVELPFEPFSKDYAFNGWYYDLEYTNPYIEKSEFTSNTSLYAKWIKKNLVELKIDNPVKLAIPLLNQITVLSFKCYEDGDYIFFSSTSTININATLYRVENNRLDKLTESQFQGNRFILPFWLEEGSSYELRLNYDISGEYPFVYVTKN